MSGSAIDLGGKGLEDDDLVLGGSSPGSDVAIGADSGISLIDPADSGLSLEQPLGVGSGASLATADEVAAEDQPKSDSDFLLTPLEDITDGDASESGSQVIALDTEADESSMAGVGAGDSMASMLDEDLGGQPAFDLGMGGAGSPLSGAQPGGLVEGTAAMQPGAVSVEAPYTSWQIAGLAACVVLLMLCGMMMYDLLRHMWSWGTPYTINSWLMDLFVGK